MATDEKKLCFVVMGFGKKTDYSDGTNTPRTLDLDASYAAIIKPAIEEAGLTCLRADEISHSGVIDQVMFEMLLRADLVVADISTANPNALYELGVRHALKPRTTIVIKDVDGKFLFDLNHLATLQYKHLGEDIGVKEATKKKLELKSLIATAMTNARADSPVYTFLHDLREPVMSNSEFQQAIAMAKDRSETLSSEVEQARRAAAELPDADHSKARDHFARALALQASSRREVVVGDPYLVQQLALHTYKAKQPNPVAALEEGFRIISQLKPDTSTDPETLGIAGAIQKRLWQALDKRAHLESAIEYYGRGFEVKRDYYTGENYALCLDLRASVQSDPSEAEYDRRTAHKVRLRVADSLKGAFADPTSSERTDYKWMLATMANVGHALGLPEAASFETRFLTLRPAPLAWELETFNDGKRYALKVRNAPP